MLADIPIPDVANELAAMRSERCQSTSAEQAATSPRNAEGNS
jgi:hypothetical protein